MSYGSEYREATAYVKGGMPVTVEGSIGYDYSVGDYGSTEIETVRWHNTGKPVSKGFLGSLSQSDWDAMHEALAEG